MGFLVRGGRAINCHRNIANMKLLTFYVKYILTIWHTHTRIHKCMLTAKRVMGQFIHFNDRMYNWFFKKTNKECLKSDETGYTIPYIAILNNTLLKQTVTIFNSDKTFYIYY